MTRESEYKRKVYMKRQREYKLYLDQKSKYKQLALLKVRKERKLRFENTGKNNINPKLNGFLDTDLKTHKGLISAIRAISEGDRSIFDLV